MRQGADDTGVAGSGHTAWAAADGWLRCRPWLRGRSLRSRPHRAHRRRARPAASTIAREARMPRTCDASVRPQRIGPQCSEGAARTRTRRRVPGAARRRVARTSQSERRRAAERAAGRPRTRRPAPTPQQCARRRGATISAVDETRIHSCGGGSAAIRRSSPLQASKLQRCAWAPWQGRPQAVRECSRTAQPH